MPSLKGLHVWWKDKGRIVVFRITIIALTGAVLARLYPPFAHYIPEEQFLLIFIGPLLLLMLDILLDISHPAREKSYDLVTSGIANDELRLRIRTARLLDIAGSSTESFFLSFRDELIKSSMSCRLILRNPLQGEQTQHEKVLNYARLWQSIQTENPKFKVEVKYNDNTLFRLIIFDREDTYLGFYKWDGKKYWGHNVPMIHVNPGSDLGDHIVDIANNRFQRLWEDSSDNISQRSERGI